MRNLFAASVLALAVASAPSFVAAQSTMPPAASAMPDTTSPTPPDDTTAATAPTTATPYAPSADQQLLIDAWPAEQKSKYATWPSSYQEYFWTLDESQQKGWWALTEEQKGQVYAMTPDQRTQVWPSIVAQVNGQSAAATSANPAQHNPGAPAPGMAENAMPTTPGQPVGNSMTADAGPAATTQTPGTAMASNAEAPTAMPKDYPVCSKTVKDGCRNRGGV